MKNNKQSAFTLIELLVVIAIISLLVSILLPSLKKAKELALGTVCASQEKMMGTALAMYINEYGVYPVANKTHEILDADRGWAWTEAIYDFYGMGTYADLGSVYTSASQNVMIYTCPADVDNLVYDVPGVITTKRASYAANTHTMNGTRDGVMGLDYYQAPDYDITEYRPETYVTDPGGTFVVVDNCRPIKTTGWRYGGTAYVNVAYWAGASFFTLIHNDGNNYLFCDGHVSWMKLDATCSDIEDIKNGIWTPWAD